MTDALLREGIRAFHFTREYVGEETLPPIEGWSWYDWCVKAEAELSRVGISSEQERDNWRDSAEMFARNSDYWRARALRAERFTWQRGWRALLRMMRNLRSKG